MGFGLERVQAGAAPEQQLLHVSDPGQAVVLVQRDADVAQLGRLRLDAGQQVTAEVLQSVAVHVALRFGSGGHQQIMRSCVVHLEAWFQFNLVVGVGFGRRDQLVEVGAKIKNNFESSIENICAILQNLPLELRPRQPTAVSLLDKHGSILLLLLDLLLCMSFTSF